MGAFGLIASTSHLGQPTKAWRAFLGLRRSWLSREIVAFGLWMPFGFGAAVIPMPILLWGAVAAGFLAVICSAMVYVDTHRPSWRAVQSFSQFVGTVAVGVLSGFFPLLSVPTFIIC